MQDLTRKSLQRLDGAGEAFKPFSIGLIADPQVSPGQLKMVSQRLDHRQDLAFTIILGDLTDRSLRTEFLWVGEVVETARLPILTVVGNHDGLIYGEEIYQHIFGDLNYSFLYQGVKFVFWNNNPFEWGYPDFDWLRDEVSSYPRVILVAHQPPGGIDRFPEANDELQSVYESPNLLGSVHGHMHWFELKQVKNKPVMTVARVREENFAVMHVNEDSRLTFERCAESVCSLQE